jgi:hypothetical protein
MTIERLKPQMDVPLRVRLDASAEGLYQAQSQWPDYKYTVNNGKGNMYLLPQAREALIRSGAQAGDDVEILKRQDGRGSVYEVKILTPKAAVVARPVPARPTNGHPAPPPPVPADETGEQRIGRRVKVCGRIALDAIADWEAYSAKLGVQMQFESDDVRALAITLLIEIMRREGGR